MTLIRQYAANARETADWFPKDTWLLIAEPIELDPKELLRRAMVEKIITFEGNLREEIANAIKNCMRRCIDVSEHHLSLL